MSTKRWVALGIALALLILYTVGQFTLSREMTFEGGGFTEEVYKRGGMDRIALLEVEGVIMSTSQTSLINQAGYNHDLFMKELEHAFKDASIKGIVLQINSPGGSVVESDEIYHKITKMKTEYRDKPIVTYMSNMAASGGYYIAAPTDKIYANRSTLTGSIGVIINSYDVHELAENWGIRERTFKSGPYKDILSSMREMTESEKQIIQAIVDQSYHQFVDIVAKGREMDRNKVLELADGRIYTGLQAKENGLVDEIGFLEDAITATSELAKIENPTVIKYKQSGFSLMGDWLSMKVQSNDWLGIKELVQQQYQPSLMYLFTW